MSLKMKSNISTLIFMFNTTALRQVFKTGLRHMPQCKEMFLSATAHISHSFLSATIDKAMNIERKSFMTKSGNTYVEIRSMGTSHKLNKLSCALSPFLLHTLHTVF
jgi:hypothetical protein